MPAPTSITTRYTAPKMNMVFATPNCATRETSSLLATAAPPPNPMIAMPVAMPRRSGNHFTSVLTGAM